MSYLYDDKQDDYRTRDLTHKPDFGSHDDIEEQLRAVHAKHKPALTANLSSSASPFTLLAVCKRWRDLSQEDEASALWISLAIYKPREAQLPSIHDWIKRAAVPSEAGKTFVLNFYLYAPAEDEYEVSTVGTILDIFLSSEVAGRLNRMTIKVAEHPRFHNFPRTINAPYLEFVELDFGVGYIPTCLLELVNRRDSPVRRLSWRPASTRYMSLLSEPWARLTHLKLPILDLSREWNRIRFRNVKDLLTGLIYCENLVDLEIAMAGPSSDQPEIQLFEVNPSRDERTWKIFRNRGSDDYASTFSKGVIQDALKYQIVLPRLLRLKFEGLGYEADPFLFRLKAPNLRSLEIINHKDLRLFSSDIFSSLLSAHPVLTHLSITDLNMDMNTLINLLAYPLPELRYLELYVPGVGNRVMRALTLSKTREGPMPNIRKLVLPKCTAWNGHLVDMVMSRRPMLKELRLDIGSQENQYMELRRLRWVTRNLSEGQFSLVVD